MHIGLIGGIGPAATITYYLGLVEAFKNAGQELKLTIVHADIAKLPVNAAAGRKDEQAAIFAKHLKQLKGAGCDVAMITALTGHFCFDETVALSPIPLISGTTIIDNHCAANSIKSVGLLGSPPVLKTHLFGLLKKVRTIAPDENVEALGKTYMALAHGGICTTEQRNQLFNAGTKMTADQNADAILLAGTDLGLAFDGHDPGYPVIDAVALHVKALLEMAAAE